MEDNIKEKVKEMTRKEFMDWYLTNRNYCPKELGISELNVNKNECDKYSKCSDCIREAIKGIKFKGEEETFEAECISQKKDLTEGKIYRIKQSKYSNMYELIDDTGHLDTYFKKRFKIVKNELCAEGEKVKKVRCIDNSDYKDKLKLNEIYIVKKEFEKSYSLEGITQDYQFNKNRFEEVEDVLMVECIDNSELASDILTEGKQYKVIENNETAYVVINDKNSKGKYLKGRFKPVDSQKEVKCIWSDGTLELNKIYPVIREEKETYLIKNDFREEKPYYKDNFEEVQEKKEYSFEEVILNIKEGEEYRSTREVFAIKSIKKGMDRFLTFYHNGGFEYEISNHTSQKFTKVEEPKPVSTVEAFKALEHAKENRTNLMEQVKKCVNYEKGYFELLKENEQLKDENKELKSHNKTQSQSIKDMQKDIDSYNTEIEKKKQLLYDKGIENRKLESDVSNYKNISELKDEKIKKLEDRINNYQNSILEKQDKIEELKEERPVINVSNKQEVKAELKILKLEKKIRTLRKIIKELI